MPFEFETTTKLKAVSCGVTEALLLLLVTEALLLKAVASVDSIPTASDYITITKALLQIETTRYLKTLTSGRTRDS